MCGNVSPQIRTLGGLATCRGGLSDLCTFPLYPARVLFDDLPMPFMHDLGWLDRAWRYQSRDKQAI
jgi:hypothetical protein